MEREGDLRLMDAVEACVERTQAGEPLDVCLADYPAEYHDELRSLVPAAEHVRRLSRDPSPVFVNRLEQALLGEADRLAAEHGPQGRWLGLVAGLRNAWLGSAMRAAALVLVLAGSLVGLGVGLDYASADSLPDSPLYQVKQAREWAELALARDDTAQVNANSRHLAERRRELQQVAQAPTPRPAVVERLSNQAVQTADRLVARAKEAEAKGNTEAPAKAAATLRTVRAAVERAARNAPPQTRPRLEALAAELQQRERQLIERAQQQRPSVRAAEPRPTPRPTARATTQPTPRPASQTAGRE